MKRTTVKRVGIGFNADDLKLIATLQKKYGAIGPTAIIRMALRTQMETTK